VLSQLLILVGWRHKRHHDNTYKDFIYNNFTYDINKCNNTYLFLTLPLLTSVSEQHIIPQSILEASIKITNEPPTGMQANLHKALDNFDQVE
jgi:hypothetical protein